MSLKNPTLVLSLTLIAVSVSAVLLVRSPAASSDAP